jgi:hypothetical protein
MWTALTATSEEHQADAMLQTLKEAGLQILLGYFAPTQNHDTVGKCELRISIP